MNQTVKAKVVICNQRGLHARAAAKIVKLMNAYSADVSIVKEGMIANARSIMGLMMLGAAMGTELEIQVFGSDGDDALVALVNLIEGKFDEDQ